MSVIFEAENYRGLKKVRWAPSGVCALVGPNGSGKTTLLRLPELFRYAVQRGFNEAVGIVGGFWGLQHMYSDSEAPVVLRIRFTPRSFSGERISERTYQIRVKTGSLSGIEAVEESLFLDTDRILHRDFGAREFTFDGKSYPVDEGRLCLKQAVDRTGHGVLERFIALLGLSRVYSDYDLDSLRERGSLVSADTVLDAKGRNAFSVLRNWQGGLESQWKYDFIRDALRLAFPGIFYNFGFQPFAQAVSLEFIGAVGDASTPISVAPNGLLVGLLHLMAVVGNGPSGYVALDEMENTLHPHAIRSLLESFRSFQEFERRAFPIVAVSTHSPVVLDCFNQEKENIFVMQPGEEVQPVRLTDLGSSDWLAAFSAGQIYTDEEVGAPVTPENPSKR